MDEQLPAAHPHRLFGLLSKKSLAKIKAARAGAIGELLTGLSRYWESVAVGMAALRRHDPAELMSLFERYAELQFDACAEEFLPHFSDVDLYAWHLATDVIDRISNEISPAAGFIPGDTLSGEWTELLRLLKDSPPKVREESQEALSDPSGDWEIYVGRTFRRHLIKHRVAGKKWDDPETNKTVRLLNLIFQLKYQFISVCLRTGTTSTLRMRAHMSNRLAFWEAQAYSRMVAGADEIEVPKLAPTLVVVNKSGANRRTIVDGFKSKVAEAGRDITRKDIWTVAGYSNRTEFERFQRGEARATQSAINSFNRVLNMKPEEFIRDLEKKTAK